MLQDELTPLSNLVDEFVLKCPTGMACHADILTDFEPVVEEAIQHIRAAWNAAAFSNCTDHSLKRYFHFHLEGIREILDTLHLHCQSTGQNCLIEQELLDLIRYQHRYFRDYFNDNAIAPLGYCKAFARSAENAVNQLKDRIATASIDPKLAACLTGYFKKTDFTDPNIRFTYSTLFYFEHFLKELQPVFFEEDTADLDAAIAAKLTGLNFNSLDFFCYQKEVIKKAVGHLSPHAQLIRLNQEIEMLNLQPAKLPAFDPRFPALYVMLKGWLVEEVALVKETMFSCNTVTEKVSLNLSVAHLACFTRVFVEENIYNSPVLTPIFKFIAGHYQTKRQTCISTGSLSKEYYSISQVTAAVVRDKLLKMVARINREYFPVMAAGGAATLLYSMLR